MKPSRVACARLLAAIAIATPASAQTADGDPTGIEVGARFGYARALGSRSEGNRLENSWDGGWPLALDVGYRLTPHFRSDGKPFAFADVDQFAAEMDDFATCVRDGKATRVPGEEGLRDVRIIDALYRSAATGREIKLG